LKPGSTWADVKKICDEAKKYNFVAVCIPPYFTSQAKDYLKSSKVKIATVIGFPFGYNSTKTKVFETE
jgi:deoxyribose-phosphate aldolase